MTEKLADHDGIFAIRHLSVLAYAQGFTQWHYKARCPRYDVSAPEFFNPAHEMLCVGDMIVVSASDGGRMLFVCSISDGRVLTAREG